jgi:very-short-patch-repair endonuclease
VLACGEDAVLSHVSAAVLWGLRRERPGPVHVTVPGRHSAKRAGIVVHATRSLPSAEIRTINRIPVTGVERTLVDLAREADVERMVEQAYAMRLIGPTRIREALARANGKRGTRRLRLLFARLSDDLPMTRSELERRFLRLVEQADAPKPQVNRHHATHRVDFAWPDRHLVVETDGRTTHDNPYAFHTDRARDLELELADLHVIRLSWWQVTGEPERVSALLRRRLGSAG